MLLNELDQPLVAFRFIMKTVPFDSSYQNWLSGIEIHQLIHARKVKRMPNQRLILANAVAQQMEALKRLTAPDAADAGNWIVSIDMDTNRPVWFPKDLSDEFQRLRFTDEGEPRP